METNNHHGATASEMMSDKEDKMPKRYWEFGASRNSESQVPEVDSRSRYGTPPFDPARLRRGPADTSRVVKEIDSIQELLVTGGCANVMALYLGLFESVVDKAIETFAFVDNQYLLMNTYPAYQAVRFYSNMFNTINKVICGEFRKSQPPAISFQGTNISVSVGKFAESLTGLQFPGPFGSNKSAHAWLYECFRAKPWYLRKYCGIQDKLQSAVVEQDEVIQKFWTDQQSSGQDWTDDPWARIVAVSAGVPELPPYLVLRTILETPGCCE